MPRVLAYTPTYNDLLEPETVASIEAMTFNGTLDWVLSDENPFPGRDMRNAVFQFRKGRQLALDGGYDALLTVEHDMIVPEDAAQKLYDTDAPVVYGAYQLRHKMFAVNLFRYEGTRNMGMSLSLYPRELQYARQRGWVEVSGAGFGCTLFRREVLEAVPFRDAGNAPDLPFAKDCVQRGFRQVGRTDVICGHIDRDWTQRTLWPFEDGGFGIVARVLALQDVIAQDEGQSVTMKTGKYYSVHPQTASDLQRAGYVRITNDADTVVAEEQATATNKAAEQRETAEAKRKTTRRKRATGSANKASSKKA